ncbi:MAG: glycosyltransferase, partial [Blastocatellia bacterium]
MHLSGWCFHRQHTITDLAVTINNQCHPAIAHSIRRRDVGERYHGFSRNALQSGFWAIVPTIGHSEPATVQIGLRATLSDQTVILVELGAVNIHSIADASTADETSGDLTAICMASYNPPLELFRRQIESIRHQTHSNWICLISDDASRPEILAEMRAVLGEDSRFRLFPSEKRLGFYHNFERSLLLAPREARYICLSDQDDGWRPEKLRMLLSECDAETQLVYSDMRIVDAGGTVLSDTYWTTRKNNYVNLSELILANTITGAASLFPRRLLQYLLPFPPRVGNLFHDHWLACVALALGKIKYVDRPLYDYVQHSSNVLGHSTVGAFPA